jgi:hypothetical protein
LKLLRGGHELTPAASQIRDGFERGGVLGRASCEQSPDLVEVFRDVTRIQHGDPAFRPFEILA